MPLKTNCTITWFLRWRLRAGMPKRCGVKIKKPRASECARFSRKLGKNISSSLAVFYVEQVALNRHDQSMSRKSVLLITQLISPWQFNNIYCRIKRTGARSIARLLFAAERLGPLEGRPHGFREHGAQAAFLHLVNCGGGGAAR